MYGLIVFRFRALLKKYTNVDVLAMSFPENWQEKALSPLE